MPNETLLALLSGFLKAKANQFEQKQQRKQSLSDLLEKIKLEQSLKTQEFESWLHKKTGRTIPVPKTANLMQRMSFMTQGYVPANLYPKLKTETSKNPAPKKQKISFERLPTDLKLTVPYWNYLDKDLQDTLIKSYIEERLKQQKLVSPAAVKPEKKNLADVIRQNSNSTKKQSTPVLPNLTNIQIPKSISDKINAATMVRPPIVSRKKQPAPALTTPPLKSQGFTKKNKFYLPNVYDFGK